VPKPTAMRPRHVHPEHAARAAAGAAAIAATRGLAVLFALAGLSGCAAMREFVPSLPAWPAAPLTTAVGLPNGEGDGSVPLASPARPVPLSEPLLAAAVAPAEDPSYLIGPEDALDISVWKDETLKGTVLVRPDGAISFPLVGELPAAGRTATQIREEITRRLARFMPEPEVTVSVLRVSSVRIYVIGRVNKPGDFTVGRPIDVLQALSVAGGLTPFASEDEIRIIRRVNGRQVSLPFDYARVRRGGELSQNILLRSGDVLLVP